MAHLAIPEVTEKTPKFSTVVEVDGKADLREAVETIEEDGLNIILLSRFS